MKKAININGWTLSVIDDGYGRGQSKYEIGLWKEKSDIADKIKIEGWLTLEKVLERIQAISEDALKVYANL